MSFMTHFSPTPREELPRSARSRLQNQRPGSSRNPITGEESPHLKPAHRPVSQRPADVPELDLGCFKAEPRTVLPEHYDYNLDSGRSEVSTISWGTETGRSYSDFQYSSRSNLDIKPSARVVSDDSLQQQLKLNVYEERKPVKQKTYGEARREVEEEDFLDQNWSKRKPASKDQLLKKMDAEELLEHNKKLKLIETVLADQLSRYLFLETLDAEFEDLLGSLIRGPM